MLPEFYRKPVDELKAEIYEGLESTNYLMDILGISEEELAKHKLNTVKEEHRQVIAYANNLDRAYEMTDEWRIRVLAYTEVLKELNG